MAGKISRESSKAVRLLAPANGQLELSALPKPLASLAGEIPTVSAS